MKQTEFLRELRKLLDLPEADGKSSDGPHSHQCDACKLIWHHDPDDIPESEDGYHQYKEAHKCPECKTEQRFVYQGDDKPQCEFDGKKVVKL